MLCFEETASVSLHTVAVHRLLKENFCGCQAQLGLLSKAVHPQCSSVQRPARKWLDYRSYPKGSETQMCYWKGMNIPNCKRPDDMQEVTFFLWFSKWSVQEPGRCLARPQYDSKPGRWHQVKPPTRTADLVPLVVVN